MKTTTKAWDEIFQQRGRVFTDPHGDIPEIAQDLMERELKNILDLGCGTGRHVIYFAQNGFSVSGLDNSPQALEMTKEWLNEEHLEANLQLQEMTEKWPYEDHCFDAIISVQVIHHADITAIKQIIQEMERVIRIGGFLFVTVPQLRNQGKNFKEIEPHTFIPLDGPEKGLPHHYFTPDELRDFFVNFEVKDIHLDEVDHYCLSASKLC